MPGQLVVVGRRSDVERVTASELVPLGCALRRADIGSRTSGRAPLEDCAARGLFTA